MYLLQTDKWYLERLIYAMGGTMVLLSLLLAVVFSLYWLWLTALVGVMLLNFGITGFCPSAQLFHKMGVKPRLKK